MLDYTAEGNEGAHQLLLRRGEYPDDPGGPNAITKALTSRRGRPKSQKFGDAALLYLKTEEGSVSQGRGQL